MNKHVSLGGPALLCAVFGTLSPSADVPAQPPGGGSRFLDEPIYDTRVHSDEALVNVQVANSRWPDCTTLESAVGDVFRIEGVADKSGQEKALALWKWFRILVSATGGSYAYEGPQANQRLCHDPHKILTVYGHHQCDGLSWAMVGLWRAAGCMAFDECTWGHTSAALRYRDDDGQFRYHSFDPQRRYYHWDKLNRRVSTRSMPVMHGMVYRHLTAPRELHSLRTSLRLGETVQRRWDNGGHVVPSGKDKRESENKSYYAYRPGKTDGIYASVGEEIQTYVPSTDPATFARCLYEGSQNAACTAAEDGKATLHPRAGNNPAVLIYRLAPPYVIADARCEATLLKSNPDDVCRLWLSWDGQDWQPIYQMQATGEEHVVIDLGEEAWKASRPNAYTAYNFYVKAELSTAGDVRSVGIKDLKIVAYRMLNKRTLPNLRPGENILRVTADRITPSQWWGKALAPPLGGVFKLEIAYRIGSQTCKETRFIRQFPDYLRINVPEVAETVHANYDQRFNDGPLQMAAITMRLVPAGDCPHQEQPSLNVAEAERAFQLACPHPADMTHRQLAERSERGVRETSGFFPQGDKVLKDEAKMNTLIRDLTSGSAEQRWLAAEELGNYPQALDALLEALPKADIDLTLFLCKGLAQIGDRKAIGPLLAKWKRAPRGAPGTRYVPDALAAIGDRSVVPDLVTPLERCRFDYRFHIAHALGILGGPEAEKVLQDLAENDPFPAVREEAKRALAALRAKK